MRAVVCEGAGDVSVLHVREDVPQPAPGRDEVLVRVVATALNRADILQRMGRYPAPAGVPANVPGLEFAGVIERIGDAVLERRVGERVFGLVAGGAYAEYLAVHERIAIPIPAGLDFESAAAVPEAFTTAHDALFRLGRFAPGGTLLIQAVGSSVGIAAVQLAKAASGFCIGTSRTQEKLARAREQGADLAVLDDADTEAAVIGFTQKQGVDVIFDFIGPSKLESNLRMLRPCGRIIQIGMLGGVKAEVSFAALTAKRATIIGTMLRHRPLEEKIAAAQEFARGVVPLLGKALHPVIDSVYPLERVREAHTHMENNRNFGKIVLRIST